MKFEYRKNKNGTIDIIHKTDELTVNLHGTESQVRMAYESEWHCDVPDFDDLIKFKSYNFETLDTVSKTDEPDDEYVKTYREDFEDKYPKSWCNGLCVNVLYYGSEDCRCPGISCKECWNRDLRT